MPDRPPAASMYVKRLLCTLIVGSLSLAAVVVFLGLSRSNPGEHMATLQLHVSAVAGAARRQHVILQQQLAWDSHSAGLQGGQSQAQRELAKQAMRLEILLGQAALGQPELLQHLQGAVQLEEMSEGELQLHCVRLQDLLAERVGRALGNSTLLLLANGTASEASAGLKGASFDSAAAPACQRPDLPTWCYAFESCDIAKVALVGNGPLTAEQREDLRSGAYQVIVRFNFMNNRAPGEQVDVWVLRSAEAARLHFWGISQMAAPAAREALAAARSLWFLGTPPDGDHQWYMMQPVYRQYPEVKARHHVLLDPDQAQGFGPLSGEDWLGNTRLSPSTGWYGASFALECTRRIGADLHVFGFNWNDKHADTHTIAEEQRLFRAAEAQGTLVIHPTACDGLRTCLPSASHKDCHLVSANGKEVYSCTNKNLGLKGGLPGSKSGPQHVTA